MAAQLSEITDLAAYPPFLRKVRAAMVKAAVAVGAEQPDPNDVTRSTLRRALSVNVFITPDDHAARFAAAVAANPVITHASSDSDIEFSVNAVFDTIAGAPPLPD